MNMTSEFQPYVGPKPFEEADRHVFFGRDAEANELLSLIVAHPAVLVYAQSGAGKTSLLNAKIVPALKGKAYEVLPVARVQGIESEDAANIYVFNTLISWADGQSEESSDLARMSLAEFLRKRPHVQRVRDFAPQEETTNGDEVTASQDAVETQTVEPHETEEVHETEEAQELWELPRIAVFDQFEELFTSYPNRWQEREAFFQQIREALDDDYLLRVVFMMREDYIAELDPYVSLLPGNLRVRKRLERLGEKSALDAVVKPLQFTNRKYGKDVAHTLVQNLMRSSNGHPGVEQFIEAVQLQVVCQSLWQSLKPKDTVITLTHLKECGDVKQALMSFYEKSIRSIVGENGLADGKRRIMEGDLRRWFEKVLITPEKKRATVYRAERTGGMPNDTIIVPLERVQLIKGEWRAGARWYELSHDRFIEPILTSNQKWLEKQSAAEQIRQRLEIRAAEYAQGVGSLLNQDELVEAKRLQTQQRETNIVPSRPLRNLIQASLVPEQRRRLRFMSLGVAALLIILFAVSASALVAYQQWKAAETAKVQVQQEKTKVDKLLVSVSEAWDEARKQEGIAKEKLGDAQRASKEAVEAGKRETLARKEMQSEKEKVEAQNEELKGLRARDEERRIREQELVKAERARDEAARIREQELAKADSLNSFGFGLFRGGSSNEEAIAAHEGALEKYRDLKERRSEANTLTYIARVYAEQARSIEAPDRDANYAKAEDYYRKAIVIRREISPVSNELARVINYLALVYDAQDRLDKELDAENVYLEALRLRENIFRETRPLEPTFYSELVTSYRNLAGLYQEFGRYAEAVELVKKAREVSGKATDSKSDNVILADTSNQLAVLYYFQGKYADAEQLLKDALLINKTRAPEQPQVASNLHNLGLLYFQMAKYKEAEELEKEALSILWKATDVNHDGVALSLMTLARLNREIGNIPAAEKNYQQAVDEMIKARGKEGRRVAIMKHYQADFFLSKGDIPRAEKVEQEAIALLEKGYGPDHWYVSRSLGTLAAIRASQGKLAEAESLYKQALDNLKVKLGANHPEVIGRLTDLAKVYIAQTRYDEAEQLLKEALAVRERMEPNHPSLAAILENYSILLQRTGRETEAKEKSALAQAIRDKVRAAYEK
jgi:tetratricopeptide (TPR) repeat protein